jgi:8-oxo-dGTP pyrophosphatase MutT (NUDIX family)
MGYAYFQVSVKALLTNNNKTLILKTPQGKIDFAGGRIDDSEYELNFNIALMREIKEELGEDVNFIINDLAFVSKRAYHHKNQNYYLVAIFYQVDYLGGKILLSDEHLDYTWLSNQEILSKQTKFQSPSEYEALNKYLKFN